MALDPTQLATLAGVLIVLFVVIVVNNVLAAQARSAKLAPSGSAATHAGPVDPLLVKFARHEGSVVGESVAVTPTHVILKQSGVFKAVPKEQCRVEGEDILVTGHVDWVQAANEGAAWHASHRADAVPEVSGQLTRSEDVKAPALESTRER